MNELKNCPFCGSKVQWCGDGWGELSPHDCDHIHCQNCGMHFSNDSNDSHQLESFEQLKEAMFNLWETRTPNYEDLVTATKKLIEATRWRDEVKNEWQRIELSMTDTITVDGCFEFGQMECKADIDYFSAILAVEQIIGGRNE